MMRLVRPTRAPRAAGRLSPALAGAALFMTAAGGTATPAQGQSLLDTLIKTVTQKRSRTGEVARTGAAGAAAPVSRSDPATFDVAGVRLGDTPDQVRAALLKAGYRIPASNGVTTGASFAAQVAAKADERRGNYRPASKVGAVVTGIRADGPNRERISITLPPLPSGGSAVSTVELSVPSDVMTARAFTDQAVAKYGIPMGQFMGGQELRWCSEPLRQRCAMLVAYEGDPFSLPYLKVEVGFGRSLTFGEGGERAKAREREFAAAVERTAPKLDRAAF